MRVKPTNSRIHSQLDDAELAVFLSGLAAVSRPIVSQWFRTRPDIEIKADTSPVTIADRTVELALRDAIANHPLNQIAKDGDEPRNKIEELQRLAVNVEAQLAVLDMEDEVLGHMAKLLSLDAMAFAEEVAELAYLAAGQVPETADFRSPAAGVKLFVNF